jgi:uncharacterized RDD family membrane protein YckC
MAALGITVLKHNAPWGPFTRAQIDDGLARGDFTVKYLAHAPGLKEGLPLGEVLDYVERNEALGGRSLPPVPEPRDLPPPPPMIRPPVLPAAVARAPEQPAIPAPPSAIPEEKNEMTSEIKPDASPEVELTTASFFPRGIAFLLDCAILFVPLAIIYAVGALAIEIPGAWQHIDHESRMQEWALLERNVRDMSLLVAVGFGWLYGAGLESSKSQATFGKRWMGIKVTDAQGERLGFLRATARYAAKYLSALPCFLGFILALFSSRGLALHDRLTDTRVIRKS